MSIHIEITYKGPAEPFRYPVVAKTAGWRPPVGHEPLTPPCRACNYPLLRSDNGCPRCRWEASDAA